jgi:hypothetical protein
MGLLLEKKFTLDVRAAFSRSLTLVKIPRQRYVTVWRHSSVVPTAVVVFRKYPTRKPAAEP